MGLKMNDAYAGSAEMPNGRAATVVYLDATDVLAEFGYQPPGHPARKRVGWYWRSRYDDTAEINGPFTSSRLAMMDALAKNRAPEPADA